eukprot:707870-Pleurochrysis_carterae.AAC.1
MPSLYCLSRPGRITISGRCRWHAPLRGGVGLLPGVHATKPGALCAGRRRRCRTLQDPRNR